MRISIITVVYNTQDFIESSINSVVGQSHDDIENIIIDGGSSDGTLASVRKYEDKISTWISEPDKGIYYALNKGIRMASGDIIGSLHADDFYANDNVIETVVAHMTKNNVDSCYGDLVYVDRINPDKVIRYWKSCSYRNGLFRNGWMPPHPTFFVKKDIYERYGYFNTDFKIAADYELMLRFLEKYRISTCYIPEVLVNMRTGGASNRSLKNMLIKTSEDYKAWTVNDLSRRFYTIPLKNISKIPQFFKIIKN